MYSPAWSKGLRRIKSGCKSEVVPIFELLPSWANKIVLTFAHEVSLNGSANSSSQDDRPTWRKPERNSSHKLDGVNRSWELLEFVDYDKYIDKQLNVATQYPSGMFHHADFQSSHPEYPMSGLVSQFSFTSTTCLTCPSGHYEKNLACETLYTRRTSCRPLRIRVITPCVWQASCFTKLSDLVGCPMSHVLHFT